MLDPKASVFAITIATTRVLHSLSSNTHQASLSTTVLMARSTRAQKRVKRDSPVVMAEESTRVAPEAPSRFLDLPKDIRLLVYENLEIVPRYRRIKFNDKGYRSIELQIGVGVFAEQALHFSCREVYAESTAILSKHARSEPLHINVCCGSFEPSIFLPLLHCAASAEACHKSTLYNILGFKDAGRRDRELLGLWGGKPSCCDFDSHQEIHEILSNADTMSYQKRVVMCIVFNRRQSDEVPLAQIREFTDLVQDLVRGSNPGETTLKVNMRVIFSKEGVLMSDSEFCKDASDFDRGREDEEECLCVLNFGWNS